jgi:hypothetical protein
MKPNARWTVVGAGVALTVLFAVLSRVDGLSERVWLLLGLFFAAFVVYIAANVVLQRGSSGRSQWLLVFVIVVAAASRAVLVPALPEVSTDIYRYVWEGRIITHGFNPFTHAPDAPELEHLRDRYYEDINHKHLETIYPPVAQGVFALAAAARPDPYALKLLLVLFDLGVIAVIVALLRLRSQDPVAVVVYAWNPLVIFETGHSGHVEPVGIFFLLLALWLVARDRKFLGFAAMGASFLTKYVSAVFVPFYLARKRYAPWVGVMAAVVVVGYLPFASAGAGLVSSLKIYGAEWRFNGLVYELSSPLVGDPLWTRRLLTAVVGIVIVYHSFRQHDVLRFGFIAFGTGLLLAPTLHPWYVAWIVPFLCFYRNRAWIVFTGLVFVSYWVWEVHAVTGRWELPWYVYAVEYVPFYALLVYDAVRSRLTARIEVP